MKINLNQIPPEGLELREQILASALDLETEIVKFRAPIQIEARITRITNAVCVDIILHAPLQLSCSRCLTEFELGLKKNLKFSYQVDKTDFELDLDPDIREEIILEYPIKPLCKLDCLGLCFKCGTNLNEKNCGCN